MTKEVAGVDLRTLETPIHDALKAFQELSDERVVFDLDKAPRLDLTPSKPNSARSATAVSHLGKTAGTLYVIAFAPFDGTGDESAYSMYQINDTPRHITLAPKVVPRSKAGIDTEIYLPLTAQFSCLDNHDPVLFAGSLDLLGLNQDYDLKTIGSIGQGNHEFVNTLESSESPNPAPRLTTGNNENGERFGDPHSVYNASPVVLQVCAFLAITEEMAPAHRSIVKDLKAVPALFF